MTNVAARPFFLLLLVTLGALGLVNHGLRPAAGGSGNLLIWTLYGVSWLLLVLCTIAALTQHRRSLAKQQRWLALLLAIVLGIDLVDVNLRLIQSQVPGRMLLLQGVLLLAALLAFYTYLYWLFDGRGGSAEQGWFWWIPPPAVQRGQQNSSPDSLNWSPGFVDYLYLSFTVSFSFFPHVDPIRPLARLLVISHLVVIFDIDIILLARAVSLIPT